MDFETLSRLAALPEIDCFREIDDLLRTRVDLRRDFHMWARLLELDAVQRWLLREGSWCGDAFRYDAPDGIRFVQEVFRRRLKHLETRSDPRLLIGLWRWAVGRSDVTDHIKSIWDGKGDLLKATFVPTSQLAIPEQEKAFADLLRRTADELVDAGVGHKLAWAVEALRELARERWPGPEGLPVRGAFARIVFVVRDGDRCRASLLRSGLLIPLEFRRKVLDGHASEIDWFAPRELFDAGFARAMSSLIQDRGDCFPMSVPEGELPALTDVTLTGDSGKFAVGIPQKLANTSIWRRTARAMPPWVVAAATGETATPIGLLGQKMEVFLQEGARVVMLADFQAPPPIPGWAEGRLDLLGHGGGYGSAARSLRSKGYTWPADLRPLDLERKRKWEELTRRSFIAATLVAGAAAAGGVISRTPPPRPTPAMASLQARRDELEDLSRRCLRAAGDLAQAPAQSLNPDLTRLEALCRLAGRYDPEVLEPGRRPPEADRTDVETIARHVAFDCSGWEPLSSESDIQERPIEAALSTTVRRFRRKGEGEFTIVFEMNSGGFGVVPLLQPGDRLVLGTKLMAETGVTKTSYVIRTIPAGGPSEFEETFHSVYFNGFQDQQVRGKDSDWCAIRVNPGTREASLALGKPRARTIKSAFRSARDEGSEEKPLGPPPTYYRAAGEKLPVQDWYVWPIDVDSGDPSRATIYSLRWKLDPPR